MPPVSQRVPRIHIWAKVRQKKCAGGLRPRRCVISARHAPNPNARIGKIVTIKNFLRASRFAHGSTRDFRGARMVRHKIPSLKMRAAILLIHLLLIPLSLRGAEIVPAGGIDVPDWALG